MATVVGDVSEVEENKDKSWGREMRRRSATIPCREHRNLNTYGAIFRILNFTPSWFSVKCVAIRNTLDLLTFVVVSMGTGIVSILLYNLPYQFPGLDVIAIVIFCLNVVLFIAFFLISM